jgi:hypothetical protein
VRQALPKERKERMRTTDPMKRLIAHLFYLAAAMFIVSGCSVVSYTSPSGERFSRSSLGSTISLSSLSLETNTNGLRRVELRGYSNDSAQALGAVTEAAVRAAIQSAK